MGTPPSAPLISNYTAGELSPRLAGRTDLTKYANGAKAMVNMVAEPWGPAVRRSGTRFIAPVKSSANRVRLVDFQFNTAQAYMLEFGDYYMRVFMNRGQVMTAGVPVEIATPYSAVEALALNWCQSADTMYLVHPDHPPQKLTRASHTSWAITPVSFIDGPYLPLNVSATTLSPSATAIGAAITVTASSVTGINGGQGFLSGDVGRCIRLQPDAGAPWGWVIITAVTSTTVVQATVQSFTAPTTGSTAPVATGLGSTSATTAWRLGLWCDTLGWPRCCRFDEERLFFGGAAGAPTRIDGSKSADFEAYSPGSADGDPLAYNIASDQVNLIEWMAVQRLMLVGSAGAECRVGAATQNSPLTPTSVLVKRETSYGSNAVRPLSISNVVLFVQRQGRKLRELAYNFPTDAYTAPDLTRLAEHITLGGVTDMTYQQEPYGIVWAVRGDGVLLAMTYLRDDQVVGWSRHPLGGGGKVECVATIPGNGADQVWMVVNRTINGQTVRHVEVLDDFFADDTDVKDAFFVDCGLSYAGTATSQIAGLGHLEGQIVAVLADGAAHPDCVVASGRITLQAPATTVQAGLAYRSILEPMRFEFQAPDGSSLGKLMKVDRVTIYLNRSLGCKLGSDVSDLQSLQSADFRQFHDAMDAASPLFTGKIGVPIDGDWEDGGTAVVVQDLPLPLEVVCMVPRFVMGDS